MSLIQMRENRPAKRGVVMAALAIALLSWGSTVHAGLVINPTYDASITNDANAVAIKATIQTAINTYQGLFTNPITVNIYFQEGGGLGGSNTGFYNIGYASFVSGLTANYAISGNADQGTALANLPSGPNNPLNGNTSLNVSSANGRALGFNTPGFVNGSYDGVITLNTLLTTPGSPGSTNQYSLLAVTEHEIDEVLGLPSDVGGSNFFANPSAMDLYRFGHNSTTRNWTTVGDNAYFSFDGGITDIVQYNQRQQTGSGDYGDWHLGGPPTRVQDAFATVGAFPTILNDGGAEVTALNVVGYNLAPAAVPEPASLTLLCAGGMLLSAYGLRRRKQPG